jgi:hypothetical protein
LNTKERETIYAEWLAGATIYELSKKHHHWQYTIEDVVRGCGKNTPSAVDGSNPLLQLLHKQVQELAVAAAVGKYGERYFLSLLAGKELGLEGDDAYEYARKEADAWYDDHRDSMQALVNKTKALGCPVRWQFDDHGLLLDVVPM